ncbi:MAG TPA: LysR family transcriptional regulator [Pseudolabrys sp.]|jgi:DNA-binding transcriptional LysR family regulator|nr:LysR family transcriptional regulator [Pseudolabrys sp.]
MELRHLRYFVAVADHGSFSHAAEQLGIAQPPLSQQIKLLEEELGVRLFQRLPRGVRPTEIGAVLVEQARDILALQNQFVAAAAGLARGERGHVRVGIAGAVALVPIIPASVRTFREARPLVTLSLEEMPTPVLCKALRDRTLDVAIVRPPVPDGRGLIVQRLFEERTSIALPCGHRLAEHETLSLRMVADEPLIIFPRHIGPGFHDAILSACQNAGFTPRIGQEAPHIAAMVPMVAAGFGVSIVPQSLEQIHASGVSFRQIDGPAPVAELAIATRSTSQVPLVRDFVAMLRMTCAKPGKEIASSDSQA